MNQSVNWAGNWEINAGCVERYFTLHEPRALEELPMYRVQVHGFVGGLGALYNALKDVGTAIFCDGERVLQGIAQEGRTIITLKVGGVEIKDCVVVVERDPRDFTHFVGQVS